MTGEEKRKKLKEEMKASYKRDLQKRKEFLDAAKQYRHTHKLNEAVTDLVSGLNDDSEDWIDRINQKTAVTEARMEIALDEAGEVKKELDKLEKQAQAEKFSAEELVKQMKKEMGLFVEEAPKKEEEGEEKPVDEKTEKKKKTLPPKKQLGDF